MTMFKVMVSMALMAVLTACGGGGGGGAAAPATNASTSTSTDVAAPPPVVPVTEVPAAVPTAVVPVAAVTVTYALGSEEAYVFSLLNSERSRCGFGTLAQSAQLDQSASNHAKYLTANSLGYGHSEAVGLPFFSGASEANRAVAVGYSNPVGAVLATYSGPAGAPSQLRTTKMARDLLAAPYHLLSMMDSYADLGIGFSQAANSEAERRALNVTLGKRASMNDLAADQVFSYPCQGTDGVNASLAVETPSPIPVNLAQNSALYGTPIAVKVRTGKVLNLTGVTLTPAAAGAAVAVQIVSRGSDPQGGAFMRLDSAYVLPMVPLQASALYTVTLVGTSDGVVFTRSFSFTTAP